ncbi:NUDIX hydrolase [Apilactobacillus bombintestini]|uniref:NUDIX hydrolase n=1 Tax=Apilactobacillus bombintestini TaxID=2419772 RepID=A0A387AS15_9LACO|nr:NUDIX hydrolase [Apilactobacillus bombintestini]AYF92438.1 NUDIX hydrolase [Apilactobacillus bombintestini]
MDFEEKVIGVEPKYNGSIINVERQTVELPNGETATRDVVHHEKAVGILVITKDNKMLLEKQWRAPIKKVTMEIPAGKVDSRDNDSSEHAVVRELNEETRLKANHLKRITGFYSSVGFCDEYMDLYLATDLEEVNKEMPRDQGEYLNIGEYSLDEAMKMIDDGEIDDAKTITAIYYWKLHDQIDH